MKKMFSLIICCVSFIGVSQMTNLNSLQTNSNNFQTEIPTERKVTRLLMAEKKMANLPQGRDFIRNTFIPEMEAQRLTLAPNYPNTLHIYGAQKEALLTTWIEDFSSEYDAFIVYYETLISSYQ